MESIKYPKKILVVNLGGIGDVLLSIPALRALRLLHPGAVITYMAVPRTAEIVRGKSYVDDVVMFSTSPKDILYDLRTLINMRHEHFDIAINMRTLVSKLSAYKMKALFTTVSPEISIGRDTDGRGYFFDVKIPETLIGEKFEMEYDIDMMRAIGAEVTDRSIDFVIDKNIEHKVKDMMEQEGLICGDMLICLHPGGRPSRRWPLENYACLIDRLRASISCKFVITGSRDEVNIGRYLARISPRDIKNFCGRLSITELGALIKMCGLFIVGDTGPMHIASILKTPLIALCGPGDITRFDPRNIMADAIVFCKKTACAPCDKYRCGDQRCLKSITPDEVIEAALHKLIKKQAG